MREISREMRCDDPDCNALNFVAVGGRLELKNNFVGIDIKVPVDTSRNVEWQCRRCRRQYVTPGSFFKVDD